MIEYKSNNAEFLLVPYWLQFYWDRLNMFEYKSNTAPLLNSSGSLLVTDLLG